MKVERVDEPSRIKGTTLKRPIRIETGGRGGEGIKTLLPLALLYNKEFTQLK